MLAWFLVPTRARSVAPSLLVVMMFLVQDPVVWGVVAAGGLCEAGGTGAEWPAALWV